MRFRPATPVSLLGKQVCLGFAEAYFLVTVGAMQVAAVCETIPLSDTRAGKAFTGPVGPVKPETLVANMHVSNTESHHGMGRQDFGD
jgi:hypothetical protein